MAPGDLSTSAAPRGPYSLAASARFLEGFAPAGHEGAGMGGHLHLAFCVERGWTPVGVCLRETASGVAATIHGPADRKTVREQPARILSLDVDGRQFAAVGKRDRVIGGLQRRHPGLRPVCFFSPYEAAAWALISQRVRIVQAARTKQRIAAELGHEVHVHGDPSFAFPNPARLRQLERVRGLSERKVDNLRALADVAEAGLLDGGRLRALPAERALAQFEELPGIGPFSAQLILARGAGHPDLLPSSEDRLARAAALAYGLDAACSSRRKPHAAFANKLRLSMPQPTNQRLVLVAMIFAVAMTFIDQTIVAIAVPELQKDLSLSSTGVQWVVNGYLLSLSALFALGGRLADIAGHRRMVVIGVIGFAGASALCGATPTGDLAEPWIIFWRVVQGAFAALMFPAALAIVVAAFPVNERGKAMAIFFGVTGGLTSVGPLAGGYLTAIDWRAIFWVNIPVALIALVLTVRAKPPDDRHPAPLDFRGAVLISGGMGLAVLGLQQSSTWGWGDPATWGCIAAGLVLLVAFVAYELRTDDPLIKVRIFADRGFAVDNLILFCLSMAFVPLFFFASVYAQLSLGQSASETGLYLLIFFAGFASASQFGGRILDTRGARPSVVPGCLIAAVGFALWAWRLPDQDLNNQWYFIVLAGAGMGLILGPVSTDAVNRAPRTSYGEVTGVTQTARNFGASVGMAVLGTILINQNVSNIESSLEGAGLPAARAEQVAHAISHAGGGSSGEFASRAGARAKEIFAEVQHDYALSSRVVFYVMAGVMLVSFVVALVGMPGGRVEQTEQQ